MYFTAVQMTANPAADTIRNNLADACVFSLPVTHDALHLVTPERDKGNEDDRDHAMEDPAVIVDAALEAGGGIDSKTSISNLSRRQPSRNWRSLGVS